MRSELPWDECQSMVCLPGHLIHAASQVFWVIPLLRPSRRPRMVRSAEQTRAVTSGAGNPVSGVPTMIPELFAGLSDRAVCADQASKQ